jgi:hypothetical protein
MLGMAVLLAPAASAQTAREGPRVYALTNARIVTAPGSVIERGTVLIRDGRIVAVGAQVTVPPEAVRMDLTGRTVYPGLVDPASTVGLPSLSGGGRGGRGGGPPGGLPPALFQLAQQAQQAQPAAGRDEPPAESRPDRSAAEIFGPAEEDLEALRSAGVTTIGLVFDGGLLPGQVAVVNVGSGRPESMILHTPVAQHMQFGRMRGGYPGTLMGAVAYLKQAFYDAGYEMRVQQAFARDPASAPRPERDPRVEALFPVLRGEMPVWVNASNARDFTRVYDLVDELEIAQYVLVGAQQAWLDVERLRTRGQPVIVTLDWPNPGQVVGRAFELRVAPVTGTDSAAQAADSAAARTVRANAGELARANVRFALSGLGVEPAEYRQRLIATVEAGLPAEAALRAVTVTPAELLGVQNLVGTVEQGKLANLVVASGDLFNRGTRIEHVFVEGTHHEIREAAAAPAGQRGAGRGGGPGGRGGRGGRGAAAAPADVAGGWTGTIELVGTTQEFTLTLSMDTAGVTGQFASEIGTFPVTGEVAGDNVTLRFTLAPPNRVPQPTTITGQVTNAEIRGTMTVEGQAALPFVARRRPGAASFDLRMGGIR